MLLIKKLIRYPFNLIGLQIIKIKDLNKQYDRFNLYLKKVLYYYNYYLTSKEKLEPAEYLQFLEMKYSGPVFFSPNIHTFGSATGGDRMNEFFHCYSDVYARYLEPIRKSNRKLIILEIGILNGTGLAIWDEYFVNKKIYGFDYDLRNFEQNKSKLLELGAFLKKLPTLKFYDQFADNSKTLEETFGSQKLDVVIDDAYHSDESIINTFDELQKYLSESFVYFIEDNRTAWKKLRTKYPQYNFDYNDNELTVVTKK